MDCRNKVLVVHNITLFVTRRWLSSVWISVSMSCTKYFERPRQHLFLFRWFISWYHKPSLNHITVLVLYHHNGIIIPTTWLYHDDDYHDTDIYGVTISSCFMLSTFTITMMVSWYNHDDTWVMIVCACALINYDYIEIPWSKYHL